MLRGLKCVLILMQSSASERNSKRTASRQSPAIQSPQVTAQGRSSWGFDALPSGQRSLLQEELAEGEQPGSNILWFGVLASISGGCSLGVWPP